MIFSGNNKFFEGMVFSGKNDNIEESMGPSQDKVNNMKIKIQSIFCSRNFLKTYRTSLNIYMRFTINPRKQGRNQFLSFSH